MKVVKKAKPKAKASAKKPRKVKCLVESVFEHHPKVDANRMFKILDTLLRDYDPYYYDKADKSIFMRLRDLAAAAAGQPTLDEEEE